MLPAIIAAVVVAAAIVAAVVVRLRAGKRGKGASSPTEEDESALSWRADAMSGGRPPVPEKPAKAARHGKAAKVAQPIAEPSNPVADLAAQIAAKPAAAPPAPAPPAVASSAGRNKATAARNRAAAARTKAKAKPTPPVVAPLSFDPFDDYLSAPAPKDATTPSEAAPGKTLADVRLGDYRIGEARDPKAGPEDSKNGEKV